LCFVLTRLPDPTSHNFYLTAFPCRANRSYFLSHLVLSIARKARFLTFSPGFTISRIVSFSFLSLDFFQSASPPHCSSHLRIRGTSSLGLDWGQFTVGLSEMNLIRSRPHILAWVCTLFPLYSPLLQRRTNLPSDLRC